MDTVTIRAKSTGALRRAGLLLAPLGQWVLHELQLGAVEGLNTLLRLIEDPKVSVELGEPIEGGHKWHPAPSAEDIKAAIERTALAAEQAVVTDTVDQVAAVTAAANAELTRSVMDAVESATGPTPAPLAWSLTLGSSNTDAVDSTTEPTPAPAPEPAQTPDTSEQKPADAEGVTTGVAEAEAKPPAADAAVTVSAEEPAAPASAGKSSKPRASAKG